MHTLPAYHRILVLTEGRLGVFTSKTAAVLLRYRGEDIAAIVDSQAAGQDLRDFVPWAPPRPIVAGIAAMAELKPDALFIGIAPVGGALPPEMRRHVADALHAGLDVVSGLHTRIADDAELATLAKRSGARVIELRAPRPERVVASGRARSTRCRRVLTVGTDCNVGKMVAALELTHAACRRGLNAAFAATGQTGIMIAGRGITVDAVVADFVAGAAEELVLAFADADVCFIEGQGSIGHPGYSGVTLSLLHGTCPDALILVHHAGRTHYKAEPRWPIPPLPTLVAGYERAAALFHPGRIVGVALNTFGSPNDAARHAAEQIERELNVAVQDVYRDGCERLLDAVR